MKRDFRAGNRVLWLLNHSTLRECELPILREMGYEVFTPKRFPRNSDNRSASVSYAYDDTLSLPTDVLDELNEHDFYRLPMSPRIAFFINYYFECAIVAYMFPIIDVMVSWFKGHLLLRAFGLTDQTWTYYSFAERVLGDGFRRRLAKVSDRFRFAAGYSNLAKIEPRFTRDREVYLPVGLPRRVLDKAGSWTGGDGRIMFVCPDIKSYTVSRAAYELFKVHFGHLPHIICGAQTIPVENDESVVGRVNAPEYDRLFRSCAAMFYHSELPRHIHYHPLEAISYGMPLIYMSSGMLGYLGGSHLAGAASNYSEARTKIERLLKVDGEAFRHQVKNDQSKVLHFFQTDYVKEAWIKGFRDDVMKTPLQAAKPLKIAVIALDGSTASLRLSVEIAESLDAYSSSEDLGLKIVLGVHQTDDAVYVADDPESIAVRPFVWLNLEHARFEIACRIAGVTVQPSNITYSVPEDDICRFMDCDVWLLVGNASYVSVSPLKPILYVPLFWDGVRIHSKDINSINMVSNLHFARAIIDTSGEYKAKLESELGAGSEKFSLPVGLAGSVSECKPNSTSKLDVAVILNTLQAIA